VRVNELDSSMPRTQCKGFQRARAICAQTSTERQFLQSRDSHAQKTRSRFLSFSRRTLGRSTGSCWRKARLSATRAALFEKKRRRRPNKTWKASICHL